MIPSFVSNFFWGSEDKTEDKTDHTVVEEEADDWLVINYNGPNTDDNESITSETSQSSWVVEPSPRFLTPTTTGPVQHCSRENLLLDNPTMSFYNKQAVEVQQELKNKQLVPYDISKKQLVLHSNQQKKVILYNQQAKKELAAKLGIPFPAKEIPPQLNKPIPSHPKANKKSLNKHNKNMIKVTRGKKTFKIHSCGMKAGRRRS